MAPKAPTTPKKGSVVDVVLPQSARVPDLPTGNEVLYAEPASDLREGDEETAVLPREDATPQQLDSVTYGYAAIDIYAPDPDWKRDDPAAEGNRQLDLDHAKEIASSMKAGMRVADGPSRICISMTKAQIKEAIRYTAVHELYPDGKQYERVKHLPETAEKLKEREAVITKAIQAKV